MSEFLYHYHPVEPATWFYLSSLLTIGLFFKFSRLWSVRNLDLLLLILLAPGLLFIHYGRHMDNRRAEAAADRERVVDPPASGRAAEDPAPVAVSSPTSSESPPARAPAASLGQDSKSTGSDRSSAADRDESPPDSSVERPRPSMVATKAEPPIRPDREVTDPGTTAPTTRTRGQGVQFYGYVWLFGAGGLLMIRLLADPTMVRRPLLEPNLSAGGLTFIGCSLFVFLMANVISRPADKPLVEEPAARSGSTDVDAVGARTLVHEGPGYAILASLPNAARKSLSIIAHLAIVVGMVLIGYRHFDNIVMGIGAATLYLMLPYTALMTNEPKHALPAACMVWAVLCYRRPSASGVFLGLAGGMTYYPLFLLPLWVSFYWPRGLVRFLTGVVTALVALSFVLFSSPDVLQNVRLMFGLKPPEMENLRGIWDERLGGWSSYYRIPVLAAFLALACSMALWPAQKNLGTLLSCSAAVLVATQFWHGYDGGTYMAWYLPLVLLTIFRPNLEDRVALTVLAEGWLPRRLAALPSGKAA
jgi:hypothetical protein